MAQTITRLKIGDPAPAVQLDDIQGQPRALSQYWAAGPTLLTFLRHFGCIHCRSRLAELERHRDEFAAAGAQMLAVALGRAEHAARYCGKLAPNMTCFAATSNQPYYRFGLRQATLGEMAGNALNIARTTFKALSNGNLQGGVTGDPAMMSGTFIVDRAGIIRYAYYSAYAGDDPAIPDLLAALRALQSA